LAQKIPADGDETIFTFILNRDSVFVFKNADSVRETDAVFSQIGLGFVGISLVGH